jgi:hypothetical protein
MYCLSYSLEYCELDDNVGISVSDEDSESSLIFHNSFPWKRLDLINVVIR